MFGNSWRLARVAGVEIRIDASWAVIALLVGYSLYLRFDFLHEDVSTGYVVALAAVAAVAFFGSVLLHELAHALVARTRGIPVRGITLFLFGGATHAKVESKEPKDEFLISVIGPLTSLAIAGVLFVLSLLVGTSDDPIPDALGYLAWVNLALAVFNLLPGLPLDGGRVLRSVVWGVTGSIGRATRVAAMGGQIIGWGMVALGVVTVLAGAIGGLWFAAIGWFLAQAAQASYLQVQIRRLFRGAEAEDAMSAGVVTIPSGTSVENSIHDYFLRYDHTAFPVNEDGKTTGLITLRAVRRVPREERQSATVDECMTPIDRAATVSRHVPLEEVLERFQEEDLQRVLVVDGDEVVGIVTPRDISRWLQLVEELDVGNGDREDAA